MALSTAKLDTAVPHIEINSSVRERGSVLTKKKMGWISITELKVFEFHAHKKSNSAKLLTVKVRVWQWFLGHFDVSSNINHVGLLSFNTCNSHSRTCLVYVYMVFQTERDIEIFGVKARKAVDTKSVFGLQFGLSKSFCISLYYVWFSISNFSLTSNPVWTKIWTMRLLFIFIFPFGKLMGILTATINIIYYPFIHFN